LRITLVKKIKADGSPCRKCAEVVERLDKAQLLARIDRVVVADERNPDSEGMQLAGRYNVDRAPFFIVEDNNGGERIYTSFFRFLRGPGPAPAPGRGDHRDDAAEPGFGFSLAPRPWRTLGKTPERDCGPLLRPAWPLTYTSA
jgi:hypothetical protein